MLLYRPTFTVFEILRDLLYYHILHIHTIPTYRVYRPYDISRKVNIDYK